MENESQQCSSSVQKSSSELRRLLHSSAIGHKQGKVLHEGSIAGVCKESGAELEDAGRQARRMWSGSGCVLPVHFGQSKRRRLEDTSQADRYSFEGNDGGQQLAPGRPISNSREDSCYHSDNQIRSEGEGGGSVLNLSDQDGNDSNYVSFEDDEMGQENNSSEVANDSNYVSLIEEQEATNNPRQPKAENKLTSSTETVHNNKDNNNSSKDANGSNYVSLIEKQETYKTYNQRQTEEVGSEYLGIVNYGNIVKYVDNSAMEGLLDTEPQFSTSHDPGLFKFEFDHSVSSDSSTEDGIEEVDAGEETTDDPPIEEKVSSEIVNDNLLNQENLSKSMDLKNINYYVPNSVDPEIKTTEEVKNDGLNKAEFSKPTDLDTNAFWPVHNKIETTEEKDKNPQNYSTTEQIGDVNDPPSKIKVNKSSDSEYIKSFVPDTSGLNKYPFVSMDEFNEILEKKFGPVSNEIPDNIFTYSKDESNDDLPEREIDLNQDPSYFDSIDDYPPIFLEEIPTEDDNFQNVKHPVDLPNLRALLVNQEQKEAECRKEEDAATSVNFQFDHKPIQDPTCGSSDNVYKWDDSQESFVEESSSDGGQSPLQDSADRLLYPTAVVET